MPRSSPARSPVRHAYPDLLVENRDEAVPRPRHAGRPRERPRALSWNRLVPGDAAATVEGREGAEGSALDRHDLEAGPPACCCPQPELGARGADHGRGCPRSTQHGRRTRPSTPPSEGGTRLRRGGQPEPRRSRPRHEEASARSARPSSGNPTRGPQRVQPESRIRLRPERSRPHRGLRPRAARGSPSRSRAWLRAIAGHTCCARPGRSAASYERTPRRASRVLLQLPEKR